MKKNFSYAAPQEKKWWAIDILWATLKSKYFDITFLGVQNIHNAR